MRSRGESTWCIFNHADSNLSAERRRLELCAILDDADEDLESRRPADWYEHKPVSQIWLDILSNRFWISRQRGIKIAAKNLHHLVIHSAQRPRMSRNGVRPEETELE
jgi:hypothetical protein